MLVTESTPLLDTLSLSDTDEVFFCCFVPLQQKYVSIVSSNLHFFIIWQCTASILNYNTTLLQFVLLRFLCLSEVSCRIRRILSHH